MIQRPAIVVLSRLGELELKRFDVFVVIAIRSGRFIHQSKSINLGVRRVLISNLVVGSDRAARGRQEKTTETDRVKATCFSLHTARTCSPLWEKRIELCNVVLDELFIGSHIVIVHAGAEPGDDVEKI